MVLQDEPVRRQRQPDARPQCIVLSPSSALWDQQTLLVLHGSGDSARRFAEHWRPLVDEGWTLVVPQLSQPWDDRDLARREVRTHLEECRTRRGLDPARIVMAGASQGAPLAAEIANEAGLPWLCVIPDFPAGYDASRLAAVPRHTRGVFLLGEDEPANTRARPVIASLEAAGAFIQVRTMPGAARELPVNFAVHVSDVLRHLELG